MSISYPISDPHTLSVEDILHSLQTDAETGLSSSEVANRTKEFGANI